MPTFAKSSVFTSKVFVEAEKSAVGNTFDASCNPVSVSESSYAYGPHKFGSEIDELTTESVH